MRTAAICPTCATYENALCIIYNGPYLPNIQASPLDDLPTILSKINSNLAPLFGVNPPLTSSTYLGKLYLDITNSTLYSAKSVGTGVTDWNIVVTIPRTGAPEYANNAEAVFAGLTIGKVYRTGDILKIVH